MVPSYDLAIVGAGPGGAAAALGALADEPGLRVLLLDRADFPRDKACGDGVAPHVLDLLAGVGVTGLVDDRLPVRRLRLTRGRLDVARDMARPAWVVPRSVLDARLVGAARTAGADLVRHRVGRLGTSPEDGPVDLDGAFSAEVVVGADGAQSVIRRHLGQPPGPTALALRGYAPTPVGRAGAQVIAFGTAGQPSYAWSFDRGDGLANVGYGELLAPGRPPPTRAGMLAALDDLLPGASEGGHDWRGHHLPLATSRWRPAPGRVLLVGDAAGLVNPMTGEGIYYAVATGLAAGRAAVRALAGGRPERAGHHYAVTSGRLLRRHLRHVALAARLCRSGAVLDAGLRAAGRDGRVFDDLVELGLARGVITAGTVRGLLAGLVPKDGPPGTDHQEEACVS